MPYYHEELASNWPNHMIHEVGAPPPKIDPQMTAGMTAVDGYLYGANKNKGHRNEVENTRDAKTTGGIQAPKFLSEKGRESANGERRIHNLLDEMAVKIWSRDPAAPSYLQVQEIQYGRFGIDDFDFA
jgi:PAB-dependent poly(A)-specific ribonuclease subunit 2